MTEEMLNQALETVARLMAVSAITAPKGKGIDDIEVKIAEKDTVKEIGEAMRKIAKEKRDPIFIRDAKCIENSNVVVLIGLKKDIEPYGFDCGACGFKTCEELEKAQKTGIDYTGPNCTFHTLNLGIAVGSAVKTAMIHNVDCRIMYTAGLAAKRIGILKGNIVLGIPLSAKSKNIYFRRRII